MTIAEKLTAARGERSREEVAKGVGVSASAVYMYETGARVPRDEVKVRLADYFGVSVQSLFLIEMSHNVSRSAPKCPSEGQKAGAKYEKVKEDKP